VRLFCAEDLDGAGEGAVGSAPGAAVLSGYRPSHSAPETPGMEPGDADRAEPLSKFGRVVMGGHLQVHPVDPDWTMRRDEVLRQCPGRPFDR
jgi:hypothetical protein